MFNFLINPEFRKGFIVLGILVIIAIYLSIKLDN